MKIREILEKWQNDKKDILKVIELLLPLHQNKNMSDRALEDAQKYIEKVFFEQREESCYHILKKIAKNEPIWEMYIAFEKGLIKEKYELLFDVFIDIEMKNKNPQLEWICNQKAYFLANFERIYLLIWIEALAIGFQKKNFLKNTLFATLKSLIISNLHAFHVIDKEGEEGENEKLQSKLNRVASHLIYIGESINWIEFNYSEAKKEKGLPLKWEITNKTILEHVSILGFLFNTKLPMLVKPIDWKRKDKKFYFIGGFLISQYDDVLRKIPKLNLLDNLRKNKRNVMDITEEYIEAINYIQSQPLYINESYLDYILDSDPKEFLNDEFTFSIEIKKKILGYSETITYEKPIDLEDVLINNKKVDLTEKILCDEIITILFIFNCLRKYKFYFVFYIDYRGRIYPWGYPINFYNREFFRNCFMFPPDNNEKTVNYENYLDYIEKLDGFAKKSFELNLSLKKPKNILIGLDACASAFQIQGCLIKDRNMLNLTNILPLNYISKEKGLIYNDIYSWIGENFDCLKIIKNLELISFDENSFYKMNEIFKERSFLKSLIVPFSYNEGMLSRKKKILLAFKKGLQLKKSDEHYKEKMIDLGSLSVNLSTEIDKFITESFPKLKLLKSLLKRLAKIKNSQGVLVRNKCFSFYQKCPATKIVRTFKTFNKVRYSYKFAEIDFTKINEVEQAISLLPNFIHSLDAAILVKVVLKCKKQGIKVYTIHDCFYINYENINDIIKIYSAAFVEILIDNNVLESLLNDNSAFEDENIKLHYRKILGIPFTEDEISLIKNNMFCLKP